MEIVGKLAALVITIAAIFVGSSVYVANIHDEVTQERVKAATLRFSDEVREQGKITQGMYDTFVNELDATGNIYTIDMVYSKDVVVPGQTSGEATKTSESLYTDEIRSGLYCGVEDGGDLIDGEADGEVHFNAGSYFSIAVSNKNNTMFQQIANAASIRTPSAARIEVHAGGEIRDENW